MANVVHQILVPFAEHHGTMQMQVLHLVFRWNRNGGFVFDMTPLGFQRQYEFYGTFSIPLTATIVIPIDPLTAIGLGLVTPEELQYPPGILAAFNLLRGDIK